jgi:hypothetical protein
VRNLATVALQSAAAACGCDIPTVVANIAATLMGMSGDDMTKGVACAVVKSEPERRYTLGVAYFANKPDVGVAADGFRDFAGTVAVEQAAWDFMRKGAQVGLWHDKGTEGHGTVVESYIYRGPDWSMGDTVVKAGDWLLGTVWDEETFPLVKAGLINGYSPQGSGKRRTPSAEALAQLRS